MGELTSKGGVSSRRYINERAGGSCEYFTVSRHFQWSSPERAVNCGGVLSISVNYSRGSLIAIPDPGGFRKEDKARSREPSLPRLSLPPSPGPPASPPKPGN